MISSRCFFFMNKPCFSCKKQMTHVIKQPTGRVVDRNYLTQLLIKTVFKYPEHKIGFIK